ncbi:response regulator transcription factor [Streptococcus acidominimus]|uniref:Response regulator n=1 Tax=Streptococcus acidominimus TaxID=1326 RepID=A0A1Q8EBI6_STRAI|nr:response regulator transcription factor [Streptococcus acidominimus]MBF0848444.1 response regulator transcription factor [Streptococcus danieliae]MBF0818201.1 response regulator transcription factor [Streptococcus acidominimus]MBF0838518.1 response regulator transcription factor [Streptococcus acidominimus]OLF49159.1 DNA-binding response regulator [Streptococcus acidominimus]TFU31505.1 response regulator transcription factor [Streptococcus acidominimus]
MELFVLEDDFLQQTRLEKVIKQLLEKHQIEPKSFEIFGKPNQLLGSVYNRGAHQLFFLDIEIRSEELKGLQVAQQIRTINPYATIVFVTTHSEFMPLSFRYQVSALDYIDKELAEEEFKARIEAALLYARSKDSKTIAEDSFYFKSKYAQVQYPFEELYYIETSPCPHRVILYTRTERMEFTANLGDILKQEKRLVQCHRSFIVNPANVIKVDRQEKVLYFPNGASCFISRTKLGATLAAIDKLHES